MKTVLLIASFIVTIAFVQNAGARDITQKVKDKISAITDKLSEPVELNEQNIQTNALDLILSGTISGIKELETKKVSFQIIGLIIDSFEFNLPKLSVDITSYDLDGKLGLIHVFGKGTFVLNLEEIVLKGSAKLDQKKVDGKNYVYIKSLDLDLSLDKSKFVFEITGWLNDENRSTYLSYLINNIVRNMTPEFKAIFDKELSAILTPVVANFKVPLSDLIG